MTMLCIERLMYKMFADLKQELMVSHLFLDDGEIRKYLSLNGAEELMRAVESRELSLKSFGIFFITWNEYKTVYTPVEMLKFRKVWPLMNEDAKNNELHYSDLAVYTRAMSQDYDSRVSFPRTGIYRGWNINMFTSLKDFACAIAFNLPSIDDVEFLRAFVSYLTHECNIQEKDIGRMLINAFGISLSSYRMYIPRLNFYHQFDRNNMEYIQNICSYLEKEYPYSNWRFLFESTENTPFKSWCFYAPLYRRWIKNTLGQIDLRFKDIHSAMKEIAYGNPNVLLFKKESGEQNTYQPRYEEYNIVLVVGWTNLETNELMDQIVIDDSNFERPIDLLKFLDEMTTATINNSRLLREQRIAREGKEEKKRLQVYKKSAKQLKKLFLEAIRTMGVEAHPAGINRVTVPQIIRKLEKKRETYLSAKNFSKEDNRATSFELELTNAKKIHEAIHLNHLILALGGDVIEDHSITASIKEDCWEWECRGLPLPKDEYDRFLSIFCSALRLLNAKTNYTCGLHIHVDASDFEDKNLRRAVKIWRTIEEAMFALCNKDRQDNRYAVRVGKSLNKCLKTSSSFGELFYGSKRRFEGGIPTHYMDERYQALNFHSFFFNNRRSLEFRLKEATTDEREIRLWTDLCRLIVDAAKNMSKEEVHEFSQIDDPFAALIQLIGGNMSLVHYVTTTWANKGRAPTRVKEEIEEILESIGEILDEEEPISCLLEELGQQYLPW